MKGFTLIEVLVYISLFGLLMSGAVVSAYAVLSGDGHIRQMLAVQQEELFLTRKIAWEIGQATSAHLDAGSLVLEPGPVVFTHTGTTLTISRRGTDPLPLTSISVAVDKADFSVEPVLDGALSQITVTVGVNALPAGDPVTVSFVQYIH